MVYFLLHNANIKIQAIPRQILLTGHSLPAAFIHKSIKQLVINI